MILHTAPLFMIYFGDAQDQLSPAYYLDLPDQPILSLEPFSHLRKTMHLDNLMFLHQIHSDQGIIVDANILAIKKPFKIEGDFLITQMPNVGIGVMTADCLPIVFHDRVHNIVAITHAGWRGAVQGVALKTIEHMQELYGTRPEHLSVFLGPSAKVCCYQVSDDFKKNLEGFAFIDQVLQERNGHLFFDLPLFNRLQLKAIGIKKESICLEYNICTICATSFCSFRRDGERACRQMTVVSLR